MAHAHRRADLESVDEWEARKLLDWRRRGMLREDGTLRAGAFPKKRGPLPRPRRSMTAFEIGAKKLRDWKAQEKYRGKKKR